MISDTSSCGDYSYFSDADDEYEMSHSSSMVSAASLNRQDVFLDLRKSSSSKHLVAHSISQHDYVDAGKHLNSEVIPECGDEENNASDGNLKEDNSNELDEADGLIRCMPGRQVGDRTKLKLNIPAQPVVLDDVLLSLQSELNSEISEMESEFEEGNVFFYLFYLTTKFNPFLNKPWFLHDCSTSLLNTLWENEKFTRNKQFLLFPHSVLYPF